MNRIAVFAQALVADRGTPRLSPALPPALAVELHAAILADTLAAARACVAAERTLWWPGTDGASPAPEGFTVRVLAGADAGERVEHALEALLVAPADRAVVTCSDLPALGAEYLDAAFGALAVHDAVIGPALDGGCAVVGLSRRVPEFFAGVPWGTREAVARAVAAADRAGVDLHVLPALDRLDTPADLVRLVAAAAGGAQAFGPRGLAELRRIGMLPA